VDGYEISSAPSEDIVGSFISAVKSITKANANDKIRQPLAIVFNKTDNSLLDEKIGLTAITNYIKTHKGASKMDASDKLCRQFLLDYGADNFLNTIEANFEKGNFHFFSVSSLGHNPNGSEFVSSDVELPLLYLFREVVVWGKDLANKLK
jgi:hypothetical protein